MISEANIAMLTFWHIAALLAFKERTVAASVLKKNDLFAGVERCVDVAEQCLAKTLCHKFFVPLALSINNHNVGQNSRPVAVVQSN